MRARTILLTGLIAALSGCTFYESPVCYPDPEETTVEIEVYEEEYYYVDTYIPLSSSLARLIAPHVEGYFSPAESRYSDFLYYGDFARSSRNRPCYVRGDFNDDGVDDHAFLFSKEDLYYDYWSLTTRLLVVQSTPYGMELAVDAELGSVEADYSFPIEEYWSIAAMPSGTHTYYTWNGVTEIEETVILDADAFTLTFLETEERDLIYAASDEFYYMPWDPGSLAKKASLAKQKSGKKLTATWRDRIEKRIKR
jgi:hypothetical protein